MTHPLMKHLSYRTWPHPRIAKLLLLVFFTGLHGVLRASQAAAQTMRSARFAVIGDYGQAGQPEQDVANRVKSWSPDFIITVGDNNYPYGEASTIDQNIGQYYRQYIYPY